MTQRRQLEKYVVDTLQYVGDHIALVSTDGTILCRPAKHFNYIPEIGNRLEMETLDGMRVSGLKDGSRWIFYYSPDEIAEQDADMHTRRAAAAQKVKDNK